MGLPPQMNGFRRLGKYQWTQNCILTKENGPTFKGFLSLKMVLPKALEWYYRRRNSIKVYLTLVHRKLSTFHCAGPIIGSTDFHSSSSEKKAQAIPKSLPN